MRPPRFELSRCRPEAECRPYPSATHASSATSTAPARLHRRTDMSPDGTRGDPAPCPTAREISQPPCQMGEVSCLPREQLCALNSGQSPDFNRCTDPTALTGPCDDAQGATRDRGGPIITDVRRIRGFMDPACLGAPGEPQPLVQELVAVAYVYSTSGLPSRLFQDGVRLLSSGMQPNIFGPPIATQTGVSPVNTFEIVFSLCLPSAQPMRDLAIQLNDADGNRSNPFCFESP